MSSYTFQKVLPICHAPHQFHPYYVQPPIYIQTIKSQSIKTLLKYF